MTSRIIRTAVAKYGDSIPGVLEVRIMESSVGEFLSVREQDGDGSIIVGTAEQARQLIEALEAGIGKIWE